VRRFYPARVHETVDYTTCGLWFAGPEVFQMKELEPGSVYPPQLYGILVAINTILTDFGPRSKVGLGGSRLWSVKTHLLLDAIGSSVVMLAPWVTGSRRRGWNYWVPQLAAGLIVWWSIVFTEIPED